MTEEDSGSLPPGSEPAQPLERQPAGDEAPAGAPQSSSDGAGQGAPDGPGHATAQGSALDSLFGESRFQEYEGTRPPGQPAPSGRATPTGARAARPHGLSRTQKTLISVFGVFVVALALVALFFLGTRLPTLLAAKSVSTPSPTPSRTTTPTPTATATHVGPVAVGVQGWNDLLGGECLNPYITPWAEKFTVVDCAAAHPAQMVFRGTFDAAAMATLATAPATAPAVPATASAGSPAPAGTGFPGAAALQTQISLLCAAPGVLDLAAAGQYADAQVQGSYPVTAQQWAAGQHDYFCFISRASAQPMTGSVAVTKAAPAPAP